MPLGLFSDSLTASDSFQILYFDKDSDGRFVVQCPFWPVVKVSKRAFRAMLGPVFLRTPERPHLVEVRVKNGRAIYRINEEKADHLILDLAYGEHYDSVEYHEPSRAEL